MPLDGETLAAVYNTLFRINSKHRVVKRVYTLVCFQGNFCQQIYEYNNMPKIKVMMRFCKSLRNPHWVAF